MSLGKTRKTCGAVALTIGLLLGYRLPAAVIPVSAETVTVKVDSISRYKKMLGMNSAYQNMRSPEKVSNKAAFFGT